MQNAQNYNRAKLLYALKHLSKAADALAELQGANFMGKQAGMKIVEAEALTLKAHGILQLLQAFGI